MIKNTVAVVLILAVAAGGAVYYMNITESQAPADAGTAHSDEDGHNYPADFCAEHHLAESQCPWCNPSQVEELGMCPGHGVPEAYCSRCNPALIEGFKAENDWCAGHDLPESQCTLCNPELQAAEAAVIDLEMPDSAIRVEWAEDQPRHEKPPALACTTEMMRVRFIDDRIAEDAGLEYGAILRRPVTETLTANARLTYNADQHAHLPPRAPGIVHEVRASLGEQVGEGDVLAVVDSVELGAAKAEYLQARALVNLWEKNHAREQGLYEKRVATEREVLEAETRLAESRIALSGSRQRLLNFGLSTAEIEEIGHTEDTSFLLTVRAPFAGVIVERHAVVGEVVDTAHALFSVADTSTLWAVLDIREEDAARVVEDAPVNLVVDGLRGQTHAGGILWVSTEVDPKTRTLKAYAEIPNPDGRLRASMFGTATVFIRQHEMTALVPESAVQWDGCCNVAFVRRGKSEFEPRKLHLGYETDGHYVVESGLRAGEVVVTTGSFLLKTEIMKESIGAGCCEIELGA